MLTQRVKKHFLDINVPFQYRLTPIPLPLSALGKDGGCDKKKKFVGVDASVNQYRSRSYHIR